MNQGIRKKSPVTPVGDIAADFAVGGTMRPMVPDYIGKISPIFPNYKAILKVFFKKFVSEAYRRQKSERNLAANVAVRSSLCRATLGFKLKRCMG